MTAAVPLLDVDPDLGAALTPERRDAARRRISVRLGRLPRGVWPLHDVPGDGGNHLGLLVVDGLLGRELLADDIVSLELLGPGDLVRPWGEHEDGRLLDAVVRWSVLEPARVAVLDAQVAGALAAFPEIHAALLERSTARSRRLALTQAISQLNHVERRVLALLWHLAERWGRVTPTGVLVPLPLSHRLLAQLVGARRPTVSTALGRLVRAGEVIRNADGGWLLTGERVGTPDPRTARFVAPRRRTFRAAPTGTAMTA